MRSRPSRGGVQDKLVACMQRASTRCNAAAFEADHPGSGLPLRLLVRLCARVGRLVWKKSCRRRHAACMPGPHACRRTLAKVEHASCCQWPPPPAKGQLLHGCTSSDCSKSRASWQRLGLLWAAGACLYEQAPKSGVFFMHGQLLASERTLESCSSRSRWYLPWSDSQPLPETALVLSKLKVAS